MLAFCFLSGPGESSQMFTAGNPGLSPSQKCPEPLSDLHHIQREVSILFKYGVYSKVNVATTSKFKIFCCDRLLIYGKYCSQVETAIALLDYMCKDKEDVRMKLEVGRTPPFECGGPKCLGGVRQPAAASDRSALLLETRFFFPLRDGTRTRQQAY